MFGRGMRIFSTPSADCLPSGRTKKKDESLLAKDREPGVLGKGPLPSAEIWAGECASKRCASANGFPRNKRSDFQAERLDNTVFWAGR